MRTLTLSFLLLGSPLVLSAQLIWQSFDETVLTAAGSGSSVSVLVPAGGRITLVATNFEPVDLTTAGASASVSYTFSVSGSLAGVASGTRPLGSGLFNSGANADSFVDDAGYFFWANGTAPASIELRRRLSGGSSASLLNPSGASFANMGTGNVGSNVGNFVNGDVYTVSLRLNNNSGQIAFGTSSLAGVSITGGDVTYGRYTNPETTEVLTFDRFGLMFLNTGAEAVTLSIHSIDLTPMVIPEPAGYAGLFALGALLIARRRRQD